MFGAVNDITQNTANGTENHNQYGLDFPHFVCVLSMNCPQITPPIESIIADTANKPPTTDAFIPIVSVLKTIKYVPTIWNMVLQPKSDNAYDNRSGQLTWLLLSMFILLHSILI
jgi:hypothetical protein